MNTSRSAAALLHVALQDLHAGDVEQARAIGADDLRAIVTANCGEEIATDRRLKQRLAALAAAC